MGQEVHLRWESDGEGLVWRDGEPVQVRSPALGIGRAPFQPLSVKKPQLSGSACRVVSGYQDWGSCHLGPSVIGPSHSGKFSGWF